MRVMAISRDERFSPNSVERDKAILEAVVERLERQGCTVATVAEGEQTDTCCDLYLSMGRLPATLEWLKSREQECRRVINTAEGVERCQRSVVDKLMHDEAFSVPPAHTGHGYWLKRGDAAAQTSDDIRYCPDLATLRQAQADFRRRGISESVVSAHVEGDLVKFYGVKGGFFRLYYPADDGFSKFGDEQRNGRPHHYPFSRQALADETERLAARVGVEIYGGDAIVEPDGHYCIIDFNDWPSFSRCREEAADAIARLVAADD